MALTHDQATRLSQKFHQDFAEIAQYDRQIHGLNGFAIGLSDYEVHGKKPTQAVDQSDKAFCVTVITGQNVQDDKKQAFRECADQMFNRKTDKTDLNFKIISKVNLH